jgi:hypothetical protein
LEPPLQAGASHSGIYPFYTGFTQRVCEKGGSLVPLDFKIGREIVDAIFTRAIPFPSLGV